MDDQKDDVLSEQDQLLHLRNQLEIMLADVSAKLEALGISQKKKSNSSKSGLSHSPNENSSRRLRPVRSLILDTLEDFGWPVYSRELALYCQALTGRELKPERFGSLSKDEFAAYNSYIQKKPKSRPRSVWLCHALTHDRHQAIKRLWARSDWPLDYRIVAPTTGRIQHLKITIVLCETALRGKKIAADPERIRIIAADHARDLPGIDFRRGRFDLEAWRDTAQQLLKQLIPRDEELRAESAHRLSLRPEIYQLFGVPDVYEGAEIAKRTMGV